MTDNEPEIAVHLSQLARHNDIVGFHISDPLEKALPRPDVYTITNGDERIRINTGNRGYRKQYESAFETRLGETRDVFVRLKVPLIELTTNEPVTSSVVNKYNAYIAQFG